MSTNPYEASQVGIDTNSTQVTNTDIKSLLFTFRGRVPRRIFWGVTLATTFIFYAIVFLLAMVGGESAAAGFAMMALYIPVVWISLAMQVKRWHDRDKSGWWVLISLIPLVGPIWTFVEAGCLRGTIGPNRFGADPT